MFWHILQKISLHQQATLKPHKQLFFYILTLWTTKKIEAIKVSRTPFFECEKGEGAIPQKFSLNFTDSSLGLPLCRFMVVIGYDWLLCYVWGFVGYLVGVIVVKYGY